jgi:flavodoxin
MASVPSAQIIYASTSGHTEYVVQQVARQLQIANCKLQMIQVELAKPEDLLQGDLLILASGTWNTGGIEGQMNPHMHDYLLGRAKDVQLKGKHVAIVALGDDRYFYTCRANEHMRKFVHDHGGKVLEPALLIVNEPYGQEEKIQSWSMELSKELGMNNALRIMNKVSKNPPSHNS